MGPSHMWGGVENLAITRLMPRLAPAKVAVLFFMCMVDDSEMEQRGLETNRNAGLNTNKARP
jgi:hypothetical protein